MNIPARLLSFMNSHFMRYMAFNTGSKAAFFISFKVLADFFGLWSEDCSGIKEKESSFVSIYPNPSDGLFTVDAGQLAIEKVILYDGKGRLVREIEGSKSAVLKINISEMANGSYTVKVITTNALQNIVPIVLKR